MYVAYGQYLNLIFLFEFSGTSIGGIVGGIVGGVSGVFGCVVGGIIFYQYRKNKKNSGI